MIKKKTVILLGAGAGKDCGFHTGDELTQDICNYFVDWYKQHIHAPSLRKTWEDFEDHELKGILRPQLNFVEHYRQSGDQIDLFVSRQSVNPNYDKLGKLAIVLGIIEYEKSSALQGGWYNTLFSQLTADMVSPSDYDRFSQYHISIITFNYDRSLEQYFKDRLFGSWAGVAESEINKTINSLDIVHVYGKIADLDWENSSSGLQLPYGGLDGPTGNYSFDLTNNLQLMFGQRGGRNVSKAKSILSEAEILYFLGFGYSPNNLRILDFPQSIGSVEEVYGTGINLTKRQIESVTKNYLKGGNRRVTLKTSMDCNALLRNYPVE